MQFACQVLMVAYVLATFFGSVYSDFHPDRKPSRHGFDGFIISCVASAILAAVMYGAGAFSLLVR